MFQKKSKTYRTLRAELTALESEVSRSRVAVESITSRPIIKRQSHKEVASLKSQLQLWINNINKETNKNKIMEELIYDLKGRLTNFEAAQKNEEKEKELSRDKEISQFQIRIDQIFKRHNQQIAKIHSLKEQANSNRSERVIFSNLFRKLEKQVAEHQQLYKQQLLLGEEVRKKLERTNARRERLTDSSSNNRHIPNLLHQYYEESDEDSRTVTNTLLMLSQRNTKQFTSKIDSKFHSLRSSRYRQKDIPRRTIVREEKLMYTKQMLRKISQLSNEIEKIKTYAQSQNCEDLFEHYRSVEKENMEITEQINLLTEEIFRIEDKQKKFLQQERDSEFSETQEQKSQINPFQLLGFQIKSFKLLDADEQVHSFVDVFDEIAELFKFKLEKTQDNVPNLESLKQLDQKISYFDENSALNERIKEKNLFSSSIVCCILEKMQKFGTSQKIYDDKLLREEYYKQIGTRKNIKSRKHLPK